ncbi:MAG: HAMP domain-containing sensor histidine kinase [Phycisphaeraceae bacterium]
MNPISDVLNWFAGNGRYMTLWHCMGHDTFWVALTIGLDLSVATGYALIAVHWWQNQKQLPPSPASKALGHMRNIFVFCGICGYIFIPIKMFWPAWRLYDLFLVLLVYYTWRYAWNARELKVVYQELARSTHLESALKESREESRRKSLFLSAVSHDLRTPLNALMLQAQVAQMSLQKGKTDEARQTLSDMRSVGQDAANLLNDLLELGRMEWTDEPGTVTEFAVRDLLLIVAQRCQGDADRKELALTVDASAALSIVTDRGKLERILMNLASNAVKYTDAGGVTLKALAAGAHLNIHIIDTGVGISEHDMEDLFNEFFQVQNPERDRNKGFGLGLAIVKKLASQIEATVSVESRLGHGSRFTLTLPVNPLAVAGHADVDPGTDSQPGEPGPQPAVVG